MDNLPDENVFVRYPQPLVGGEDSLYVDNMEELVGFLPGTTCRIWYTHFGTCFAEHWHNALEIIIGENGYYVSEIEGTTYEIHRGDILLIPPCVTHTLCPQKGCNGFVYLLDIRMLNEIKSAGSVVSMLTSPIIITEKNNPKLHILATSLLKKMQNEYFSNNSMRELLVYSHLLTLLAEIANYHIGYDGELLHVRLDKRKEHIDKFNEILYYISLHYKDELTIDKIAKQFGFSKFYFARLFKQYTQFTFCDYLTDQRIKAAEYLLSQPDMSITDIAFQTGFSSISTFDRVFKQRRECSPSEYRRIHQL